MYVPYATPLRLEPGRSPQLAAGLLLVHAGTLMLLPWLPVAASLQVALGLAIIASLGWQAASQVLRIAPGSLRSLTWQQGRDCRLELAGGGRLSATLEPYAFVQPWLVIIAYRVRRWPARYLLILPDMLDADTRRRLRVRLRMELPRHA